ncbi:hypothetical protein ANACOL_00029 [Anaerotruncus colihominis DSM 17241]|uniref:Uncharacterized protein n=1 Tax=Anaerotruncus colihominis DSM 17241 TaxID=445972 RepID=B0P5K8_9FIRM|nr:hypothetical protein ANACOL_00029 [Anaerotruncus colihominis DSM 17241]
MAREIKRLRLRTAKIGELHNINRNIFDQNTILSAKPSLTGNAAFDKIYLYYV